MFPEKRTNKLAQKLCNKLGGNIMVPINEKDNQEVTELATKYFKTCEAKSRGGRIAWIGLTSNSSTEWKSMSDEVGLSWENWRDGPGNTETNCAFLYTTSGSRGGERGRWGAGICQEFNPLRHCTICEFKSISPTFTLRGLCKDSPFDRKHF
ncbi:pulmonary surfactant-associated protein A [Eurytemora carolleeae]|uniref:pulmonary surfactant-associated protein A n=1 Tax=Eurytemora carolleeae TaxID=1294199 RepID=UPI000C764C58|nr:pulmonary surfactant-associated protein A [Eurytemora carolleeae]|eukprot:XP_023338667.1 pulmonary surfactant-associated protein A-like [Eurytemora affinis]